MAELLQDLLAWVSANPVWAHLAVFLVALTESLAVVGLIVPGVIMMLGAGALIATGTLDFWPVCLWAVAGAVAGDGLSYWLGRHFQDRLRTLWPFVSYPETLASGVRFFDRFGGKSVAFGRFVGPVRAVIPLVAGMMGMGPGRFFVANLLSAFLWAPAYLLPGIVFGASLELAAEAAVRLVLVALILVLGIWIAAWAVQQLFLLFSPRAGRWVENLLLWAEVHPHMGEIARALADPDHPDARTLTALAATLLLATVLFALVAGIALAGAPQLAVNRLVLDLSLSLQAPPANHLMAAASRLADLSVILPLVLVVYGWLLFNAHARHANYWLAAGAFALLAGPLVEFFLRVPRPDIGLNGVSPWAFPSDHTLRATVVYGFLAVSLADSMTATWRWLPYVWATMLTVTVGLSRLYFGTDWFTDVIGSLTLGLAWVAALGLSFRRHTQVAVPWRGLGGIALGIAITAFTITSVYSHNADLALYHPEPQTISFSESQWQGGAWRHLSQQRQDLRRQNDHPLNLQYAGDPADLAQTLAAQGWRKGLTLELATGIKLFSPSLPLRELPIVPHVHDGYHEAFALVKDLPDDSRLVLRLWQTPFRIHPETPLWVGNVTVQHKKVILDLLAVPATITGDTAQIGSVMQDFAALDPVRPDVDGPILLRGNPAGRPRPEVGSKRS